jgi:DNA polymerase III delta prime subunit
MNEKSMSPFTPGNPVSVELFVGRKNQVIEIIKYVKQASLGKLENVFLIGDRGIGKTSLASFLKYLAVTQIKMLGVHVFLGKVTTLEMMIKHIFEQIIKETKTQGWFDRIKSFFEKYIREIGMFSISVSFEPPKEDLEVLLRKFPEALGTVLEEVKKHNSGLFIVLDDINGLAEKREFADWYKSFVDEVATKYREYPVFIMIIGLPEKRYTLSTLQPSLMRIFRVIEIEKLADEEVKQFLGRAFEQANMEVKPDALNLMAKFSSGLPILMHEIGDATFWIDNDGIIDNQDAYEGIIIAAENVGKKYLDPKVYNAIRSRRYLSILRKLGQPIRRNFTKRDFGARLNENEKKVFHHFLQRMRKLGVIEIDKEKGVGAYRFANELYPIYIWMESEKARRKTKGSNF